MYCHCCCRYFQFHFWANHHIAYHYPIYVTQNFVAKLFHLVDNNFVQHLLYRDSLPMLAIVILLYILVLPPSLAHLCIFYCRVFAAFCQHFNEAYDEDDDDVKQTTDFQHLPQKCSHMTPFYEMGLG